MTIRLKAFKYCFKENTDVMKYNWNNRYNNYLINYSYNKLYYSFKETCFNQLIQTIK